MELRKLTDEFYNTYTSDLDPQIITKHERAYAIITLVIDGICFGLPVKSNVNHKYGYLFTNSGRKRAFEKPGIDYKKSVVLSREEYIGNKMMIDEAEYKCLLAGQHIIIKNFKAYLTAFKKYMKKPIENYRDANKFRNTTLIYFMEQLFDENFPIKEKLEEKSTAELVNKIIGNLKSDLGSNISFKVYRAKKRVTIKYNDIIVCEEVDGRCWFNYFKPNIDKNGNIFYTKAKDYITVLSKVKMIEYRSNENIKEKISV